MRVSVKKSNTHECDWKFNETIQSLSLSLYGFFLSLFRSVERFCARERKRERKRMFPDYLFIE